MDTNSLDALRKRAKAQSVFDAALEAIDSEHLDWYYPLEDMLDTADHGFCDVESVLLEGDEIVVTVRCGDGWKDENSYLVVMCLNSDGTLKAMYDSRD